MLGPGDDMRAQLGRRSPGGPAESGISSPGHNHIVSGSIPERKPNDWDSVLSVFLLETSR